MCFDWRLSRRGLAFLSEGGGTWVDEIAFGDDVAVQGEGDEQGEDDPEFGHEI